MPDWFLNPTPPSDKASEGPVWRRLGWFLVIALASGAIVAAAAYVLRGLLFIG
ncbi:MAG: DUF2474 domain-containing protein [Pseudomonadota bacterium]